MRKGKTDAEKQEPLRKNRSRCEKIRADAEKQEQRRTDKVKNKEKGEKAREENEFGIRAKG